MEVTGSYYILAILCNLNNAVNGDLLYMTEVERLKVGSNYFQQSR